MDEGVSDGFVAVAVSAAAGSEFVVLSLASPFVVDKLSEEDAIPGEI